MNIILQFHRNNFNWSPCPCPRMTTSGEHGQRLIILTFFSREKKSYFPEYLTFFLDNHLYPSEYELHAKVGEVIGSDICHYTTVMNGCKFENWNRKDAGFDETATKEEDNVNEVNKIKNIYKN